MGVFKKRTGKRIVVWFRSDLRLHDNEALTEALERGDEVIPIYVFEDRLFQGETSYGFRKVGKYRTKFIIEAVEDLRASFRNLGIDLVVRRGKAEEEVFKLAQAVQSDWVFCNMERTHEEVQVQNALEEKLWSIGQELHFFRGKMLYYTQDFPFPISQAPDVFTAFRKEVEKYVPVRDLQPYPQSFNRWSVAVEEGAVPRMEDFGFEDFEQDKRAALAFKGGESAALERLDYYLWKSDLITTYKKTRNGLLGGDYSSKLSPWLAAGCISPKKVYHELKAYEEKRTKNRSTYWLFFELLWRDFFRLMGKKYGNQMFWKGGIMGEEREDLQDNWKRFNQWAHGETQDDFVNANMKELNATGFMSNRGRQNVASYLVNDLKINWQMGAEYFESLLVDYDVCSNWGNWNYVAGVGNDPRENRYFNTQKQAQRYDPNGEYVKHWLQSRDVEASS